jgi:hypothetical protein
VRREFLASRHLCDYFDLLEWLVADEPPAA